MSELKVAEKYKKNFWNVKRPIITSLFTEYNTNVNSAEILKEPKTCIDDNIIFHNGEGILIDKFPNAKLVIFNNCSSSFMHMNLSKIVFPALEIFYTNIEPSSYIVMHRFIHNPKYRGYITSEWYNKFLNKWWNVDTPHVKEISSAEYYNVLTNCILIEPRYLS